MQYLLDTFGPRKLTKFEDAGNLSSVRHLLCEDIAGALLDRDCAYDIWHGHRNRHVYIFFPLQFCIGKIKNILI
jgi:hypothetical protein